MTSRQKKGVIILFIPIIILLIILPIFYYSGFFQPEFQIWGGTDFDGFIFVIMLVLGFLALLWLPICLVWGIIYLTRPKKIISGIKAGSTEKDLTKRIKLKEKLNKVDNLIFITIALFCFLIFLPPAISELVINNPGFMALFGYDPTAYNNMQGNIFGTLAIIVFFALLILFPLHFRLRNSLGQAGLDSLAEKLRNFFGLPPQKNKK